MGASQGAGPGCLLLVERRSTGASVAGSNEGMAVILEPTLQGSMEELCIGKWPDRWIADAGTTEPCPRRGGSPSPLPVPQRTHPRRYDTVIPEWKLLLAGLNVVYLHHPAACAGTRCNPMEAVEACGPRPEPLSTAHLALFHRDAAKGGHRGGAFKFCCSLPLSGPRLQRRSPSSVPWRRAIAIKQARREKLNNRSGGSCTRIDSGYPPRATRAGHGSAREQVPQPCSPPRTSSPCLLRRGFAVAAPCPAAYAFEKIRHSPTGMVTTTS
jgi:hypothetical protein